MGQNTGYFGYSKDRLFLISIFCIVLIHSPPNPIYAELAKGTMKTAYNIALSDWFNPPVIHQITRQNGYILIEASDNVLVSKVLVTILDVDEKIVERGEAVFVKDMKWQYKAVHFYADPPRDGYLSSQPTK